MKKQRAAKTRPASPPNDPSDLFVLVADKDMEHTLKGLLERPADLRIRPVSFDIKVHPNHDGGCRSGGVPFLRAFNRQFRHGLLLFDHEGSGAEDESPTQLEMRLEAELKQNGWLDERAGVVVIEPELERWIWSNSKKIDRVCGWEGRHPPLREWLNNEGFELDEAHKPLRPKEAFRTALRHVRKPPSAALFLQMAQTVPLSRCQDRSFK